MLLLFLVNLIHTTVWVGLSKMLIYIFYFLLKENIAFILLCNNAVLK